MHRPLETTFWMRIAQLLKGIFLYNTIYWRRASDDLNIQRMTREERASLRPKRNLDIIRPRERVRANEAKPETSTPAVEYSEPPAPPPAPPVSLPKARIPAPAPAASEYEPVEIRRRKKRRSSRHSKVTPKKYHQGSGGGFLGWLFKK